jgi:broad specificity phosphatase PhoE
MNKQPTTIYVVRHGESEANIKETLTDEDINRWGELQSGLTEKGKQQAREVAERIRNIPFAAIFSSDFIRAHQTAEAIADGRGMEVITRNTIRERDYGERFFKATKAEREELKRALRDLNEEEKLLHRFYPDGESALEAANRFKAFLDEVTPLYEGKTILVANHGAVMRMFLISTGWSKYDDLPGGAIKNAGYFVLETDGHIYTIKETYNINKKNSDNEA